VDLVKNRKSREAAAPLKKPLTEKIASAIVSVAASGVLVDMDLEPTSTVEGVLAALKSAFLASSTGNTLVQASVNEIKVTSMWRLKNGPQVAKVSISRDVKPTKVSRVWVGWTSCILRIRHPEATRCFSVTARGAATGRT